MECGEHSVGAHVTIARTKIRICQNADQKCKLSGHESTGSGNYQLKAAQAVKKRRRAKREHFILEIEDSGTVYVRAKERSDVLSPL